MLSKISLSAAALAAAVFVATLPGSATPAGTLSPLKSIGAQQQSILEEAHGWHTKCRKGLNGWHRHVKGVGRIQCTTAKNCYTNIFGYKVCDWF